MAREIRVSPDGDAVAIRGDAAIDEWNSWSVCHAVTGSFRSWATHVESWAVLVEGDPVVEPEPEGEPPVE